MEERNYMPGISSQKPIVLTDEQQLISLENMLSGWSEFGIARRYSMKTLQAMKKLIDDSIEIKKQKK